MKGFEKLIARKRKFGGYDVAEDVDFARTVAHVVNSAFTDDLNKEIAEKIAAALNDDTWISEDDLKELEALAERVIDRSEYGGGLILALVNMYRNVKPQKGKQYLSCEVRGSTQEEFRAIRLDIADCWPTPEGAEG